MAMASIVQGIRTQIFNAIEYRRAHRVLRDAVLLPDARSTPTTCPTKCASGRSLQETRCRGDPRVPEIQYAGMWVQLFQRIEYQGVAHPDR